MTQNNASTILKTALIIAAIELAVYGLILFLIPRQFVSWIGADPIHGVYLRWPGGTLIVLAVGAVLVLRAPARQGALVRTIALGFLLSGLALLFSWLTGEYSADTVHVAFPAILNLIVAVLLFLGWRSSRELLESS